MLLFNYHAGPFPNFVIQYWHSHRKPTYFTYYIGNYENHEVDALINQANKTISEDERIDIYQGIQELIERDKPVIFLYFPYVYFATSKQVKSPPNLFSPVISLNRLREVYIEKEGGEWMQIEIIEAAKTVDELSSGCCTLDVWAVFIADEE